MTTKVLYSSATTNIIVQIIIPEVPLMIVKYAMANIMTESRAYGNVLDTISMLEGNAILHYGCYIILLRRNVGKIRK